MPLTQDRSKDASEEIVQEPSLSTLSKCCICGVGIGSGSFCKKHAHQSTGANSARDAQSFENENAPSAYDVDYEGTAGRLSLKGDLFPRPAKPGQFFSSENFEHWKFEGLEHLTPKQKYEIVQNLNKLLADTHQELANKFNLDYKMVKDKETGKIIYQLTNKDGSELTLEKIEKIAKELPMLFNKLSRELTQRTGCHFQLVMVSGYAPKSNEENTNVASPLSTTPKPGQSVSKSKELEEENKASTYRRPTPLPDPKSIKPKAPF